MAVGKKLADAITQRIMMNIALFDFDGTITTGDTFMQFIYTTTPRHRLVIGNLLLLPFILGYKLNLISAGFMRRAVTKLAFWRRTIAPLKSAGKAHADNFIHTVVRDSALKHIKQHQAQGDKIVVVSASLDLYLQHWCQQHNIELLCNSLEVSKGRYTGRLCSLDCAGPQKAKLVKEHYQLENYQTVYAYGDTIEDKQLLSLANIKYYQGKQVTTL